MLSCTDTAVPALLLLLALMLNQLSNLTMTSLSENKVSASCQHGLVFPSNPLHNVISDKGSGDLHI